MQISSHFLKAFSAMILLLGTLPVLAQSFPNKPIHLILPYGAGGIGDLTARVITKKMTENIGQQIIIENKPSAGGAQAFQTGLQSPADGYTLVMGGNGTAVSQALLKNLPYNILTDFDQISTMAKFSLLILVKPDSKFKTISDLISYAKANPNQLNFGTVSIGSTQYLAAELFKQLTGISAQVVPFKVSGSLFTAIKSGDIDVAFEFVPPVLTSIKSNSIRALAIASEKRHPELPEVATSGESGLSDFVVTSWNAVSVKAGTPKPIMEKLNKEFTAAINSPEVTIALKKMYSEPFPSTLPQSRELMISEIAKWKQIIEKSKIVID